MKGKKKLDILLSSQKVVLENSLENYCYFSVLAFYYSRYFSKREARMQDAIIFRNKALAICKCAKLREV